MVVAENSTMSTISHRGERGGEQGERDHTGGREESSDGILFRQHTRQYTER